QMQKGRGNPSLSAGARNTLSERKRYLQPSGLLPRRRAGAGASVSGGIFRHAGSPREIWLDFISTFMGRGNNTARLAAGRGPFHRRLGAHGADGSWMAAGAGEKVKQKK